MPIPPLPVISAALAPMVPLSLLAGRALPAARRLPLQGLTILAVEDSRVSCEALRHLAQRSGARLRRAETLTAALSHLRLYRPDLVIVDLGLPDGRGEDLISALSLQDGESEGVMSPVVLGSSGSESGRQRALGAGANGFLTKPLPGLADFQTILLAAIRGRPVSEPRPGPSQCDALALCDDLRLVERLLSRRSPGPGQDWLNGFMEGLARQTGDSALAALARALREGQAIREPLSALLRERTARSAGLATPPD